MSLNSVISRNNYIGNGNTKVYAYGFKIFAQSDLVVLIREIATGIETTLGLTTDYTVSDVLNPNGGNVTLVNNTLPLPPKTWLNADGNLLTTYAISIRRMRPLTQTTDIKNQGEFYPEVHENTFDKLTMLDQQQQDQIDRSLKLAASNNPADFNMTIPADFVGAVNRTIGTNATGNGISIGPTFDEISAAQSHAQAADASAQEAAEHATDAAQASAEAAGHAADAAAAEATVQAAADAAAASATNAASSASAASTSASNSSTSASNASTSATNAASSASAASTSATNAANSASAASTSATSAATSATNAGYALEDAEAAQVEAEQAATNAAASASASALSAGEAAASAAAIAVGYTVQYFNGGSVGPFTLSSAPGSVNNVDIIINGVPQLKNSFSLAGTSLTLSEAAPTGTNNIEVKFGLAAPINVPNDGSVTTDKILDSAVTTAKIASGAVTKAKLAALGQQISSSSSNFFTASSSMVDVTNLSVTITTTGRPVFVGLQPEGGPSNSAGIGVSGTGGGSAAIQILRDGVGISRSVFQGTAASGGTTTVFTPPSSINYLDTPAAGTFTYKVQIARTGGDNVFAYYCKLIAYEL